MKTPIQELIDEINYKIDYLIQKQLEDERYRTIHYDVTIKVLGEIESILKGSYLQKEKEMIMDAFNEQPDMYGGDYDFEYYYNEKFNIKEK